MKYSQSLADAIDHSDVSKIRAALITYIDLDATAVQLIALDVADSVAQLLQTKGISLFEQENGRLDLNSPPSENEWNKVKAALRLNFSREKIKYATLIVEQLRKQNAPMFTPICKKVETTAFTSPRRTQQSANYSVSSHRTATSFNKPLKEAIDANDISAARAAIITHADSDFFNKTANALEIADRVNDLLAAQGKTLYVPDNGNLDLSCVVWDESVWNRAKAALRINFSREKLAFATKLISIRNASYSRRAQSTPTEAEDSGAYIGATSSPRDYSRHPQPQVHRKHPRPQIQPRHKIDKNGMIVTGVVVGVVVGGVVGATVGATVAGAIIGGAVVGGVSYYKKK